MDAPWPLEWGDEEINRFVLSGTFFLKKKTLAIKFLLKKMAKRIDILLQWPAEHALSLRVSLTGTLSDYFRQIEIRSKCRRLLFVHQDLTL